MKLERNARICTAFFPLWAIPYTIYNFYLSLFLLESGITQVQLGTLMSITNLSALVCSFFAGPIVDALGRKKATFIFDSISSALPPLVFFLTQNFVIAMIAMAISGLNRIMCIGYYLLMLEDTSEENNLAAMNWFNIILIAAGLTTSLAGLVVAKYGLVKSERAFLLGSFICMSVLAIARNALVKETPTGLKILQEKKKSFSLKQVILTYKDTCLYLKKSPKALSSVIVNALVYVYYTVGTSASLFFTPYFANHIGLDGFKLGLVGTVYAGGTILSLVLINPHMNHKNIYAFSVGSSVMSVLGFLLLIFCPKGNTFILFGALFIIALSYGVLKTAADSLLPIETAAEFRSGAYSIAYVVSSILSLIAIQLVQNLYSVSPNWLFGSSMIIIIFLLADFFVFRGRKNG